MYKENYQWDQLLQPPMYVNSKIHDRSKKFQGKFQLFEEIINKLMENGSGMILCNFCMLFHGFGSIK